ncbi:MAG: oxygen-independent coproporphyrinogen III oxidase [Gemmatimonadetes bacterium]|jgi:oxygen-independent coproporphyrinogen-3 oxidase|nr:oxygen-independent coproporphyrinogen III oxidase [Gemmatimonadota bacterium]
MRRALPPAALDAALDAALVARYDASGPRTASYPPAPAWGRPFGAADYRAALREASEDDGDVALYVHLPFCPQRCLYCGCPVSVTRRAEKVDAYLHRLEIEVKRVTRELGTARRVTRLHLGGGTPNILTESQLLVLHQFLERHFAVASDAERSLEADPRHVSYTQLQWLYALGFRRLSYGVQDLHPDVQRAIGRVQPAGVVREAVAMARDVGFEGLHLELVYGLPGQTTHSVASTVDEVLAWGPDRVAVFGYAHLPSLRPNQRAFADAALPTAYERLSLFRTAAERLEQAGYQWLGPDHFARPGDPLARAHRDGVLTRSLMGLTSVSAAHELGLGMSAIGDVAGRYVQMEGELPGWAKGLDDGDLPVQRGHVQTDDDRWRRDLVTRLLCRQFVPYAIMGDDPSVFLHRLRPMATDGLVEFGADGLAVTPAGRYFLRNVAMAFDAGAGRGASVEGRYPRTA